ncbi:MAG: DNA translocase FtsK [candidate division Zixibacteria bacterium]|nr:DNA translocase FtsK [candidate division Zixibacteria bacterium]
MARGKKKKSPFWNDRRKKVAGALVFVLAVVLLISLVSHSRLDDDRITGEVDGHLNPFEISYRNQGGMLGAFLSYALTMLLGWMAFFIPFGLILGALRAFSSEWGSRFELNGFLLFVISLMGTVMFNVHLVVRPTVGFETGTIGGYLGTNLTELAVKIVGELGSYVVFGGLVIILLMTYTSITPLLSVHLKLPGGDIIRRIYGGLIEALKGVFTLRWLSRNGSDDDDETESFQDQLTQELAHDPSLYVNDDDPPVETGPAPTELALDDRPAGKSTERKKAVLRRPSETVRIKEMNYSFPGLDLLDEGADSGPSVTADELNMTAQMLKETLETFQVNIQGEIDKFPGPIITRFEFKPGAGVKINRIVALADDLALALKAKRIRIVAPIPGKAAVGVEIPNRKSKTVYLRQILASEAFNNPKPILPLALGTTISGRPFVTDLTKMPHLLIAGSTGSGKSVCMNALITSLLYRLHPLQVRFVFVDPKMLELSVYKGIPHLGRPVVTSPKRAEKVLTDIVVEMERRYRKLANTGVRNIEDYNRRQETIETKIPYIVVFVDELADLMMSATSTKVEAQITRLAQMARAVGIHLILATQRPSVDVITGLIKANFPARIAFQVASKVDSRTILDQNGAEKLLGSGDMLFLNSGEPEPTRIHGAWVSSDETDKLVAFIKDQGLEMMPLDGISQDTGEVTETDIDLGDPLFKEACEVVIRHKQGSVSLLQRRLGIGYQRAARLIDKLEQAGVVTPFDGSKARDVLVDKSFLETMFLNQAEKPAGASD